MMFPLYTLCALFMAAHPGLLKETQYRTIVHEDVWELKHAYRETCLCRSCFNMRCYREALQVLYKILLALVKAAELASAPDENDLADENNMQERPDAAPPTLDPKVQTLLTFCESVNSGQRSKASLMGLICADCLDDADSRCIRGECAQCGFSLIWSRGLRPKLVDSYGKLKPDVSPIWMQWVQWSRIKSGGDGSNKEDDLRQTREGAIIQLLDEFEPVQKHHIRHSFHIEQSKAAEGEYSRNCIPGMIDCKSDYSENGSLEKAKQLQSEYWIIIYYTLLISIASFLVSAAWRERSSVLPIGAEVTVEPVGYEPPADGSIEAVDGSFWARVEKSTDAQGRPIDYIEGGDVEYTVRSFEDCVFKVNYLPPAPARPHVPPCPALSRPTSPQAPTTPMNTTILYLFSGAALTASPPQAPSHCLPTNHK